MIRLFIMLLSQCLVISTLITLENLTSQDNVDKKIQKYTQWAMLVNQPL